MVKALSELVGILGHEAHTHCTTGNYAEKQSVLIGIGSKTRTYLTKLDSAEEKKVALRAYEKAIETVFRGDKGDIKRFRKTLSYEMVMIDMGGGVTAVDDSSTCGEGTTFIDPERARMRRQAVA
jgi:hypothetical protein